MQGSWTHGHIGHLTSLYSLEMWLQINQNTITHLRSCIGQVCGWVKCWLCDWAILISIIWLSKWTKPIPVLKRNRWRSVTVAFRVSPEEAYRLNMVAKTSGLTKQDYILKQLFKEEVIVRPNCRIQKILSQYLIELTEEMKRMQRIEQDDDILENITYLVELIAHMGISWLEVNKWCTDLKMVWTAATIRFITQTPRMMKNKGNALTIGFVRAFLVFSENKLRQIRVKRRFW